MHNCDEEQLHEERLQESLKKMPSDDKIEEMGSRFKALSEPSRLKILLALAGGELCVEHIVEAAGGNQSAVSHQLKTLKDNRIVKCRRAGKKILYSVSDWHIMAMIELSKEHLDCHE